MPDPRVRWNRPRLRTDQYEIQFAAGAVGVLEKKVEQLGTALIRIDSPDIHEEGL